MEIEVNYKAKDGRIFTDPLQCEDYEKKLGVIPGTIGELVQVLEERNPEHLLTMIALYFDKEKGPQMLLYISMQLADRDDPLSFEKDITVKVGNAVKALKKLPKDTQAQWIGFATETFEAPNGFLFANYNKNLFSLINERMKK